MMGGPWGRLGRGLLGAGLMLWLWLGTANWAIASVHEYPEGGGSVMVRSLQTLRDRHDGAWQVVLFKRARAGRTEQIHLRLVGFPGEVAFQHPAPLPLASRDQGWLAPDSLAEESPLPTNVGEYDVLQPMTELTANTALRLFLPTQTGTVELTVPSTVVKEWRDVSALSR
ncbi:MAG: DUF3122 domain-containing protein [Leptolyngbyaceae cyanobacterium bins.349]|nr:DUF3122 domain-containing protein [Leptolyngbyaceae cyanobacterium bins.349]